MYGYNLICVCTCFATTIKERAKREHFVAALDTFYAAAAADIEVDVDDDVKAKTMHTK